MTPAKKVTHKMRRRMTHASHQQCGNHQAEHPICLFFAQKHDGHNMDGCVRCFVDYNLLGPVHTGRGAPCNTCMQIMERTAVNGSVHTGCKQHQRVCTQICMQICLCVLCEGASGEFDSCTGIEEILVAKKMLPPTKQQVPQVRPNCR